MPPWAEDPELVEFSDGQIQLSFEVARAYPDTGVRNYYAKWAEEHDWQKVPSDVEPWSVDQWESFEDVQGMRVDQWLVHWQSPDGSESLRLALRYVGDRNQQMVYVIRSPFQLLTPDPENELEEDRAQAAVYPDGA